MIELDLLIDHQLPEEERG